MERYYRMIVTDKMKAIIELRKNNITAYEEDLGICIKLFNQPIAYVILYLNAKNIVVYDVEELIG